MREEGCSSPKVVAKPRPLKTWRIRAWYTCIEYGKVYFSVDATSAEEALNRVSSECLEADEWDSDGSDNMEYDFDNAEVWSDD